MTKAILKVVLRSPEEIETVPGVYGYDYSVISNVPAEVRTKTFRHTDGDSINFNSILSISFSIVMANDSTDRVNRISHVEYLGKLYKVDSIEPYPPRIVINPGPVSNVGLKELVGENDG